MNIPNPQKYMTPAVGGLSLAVISLFIGGTAVETAPVATPVAAFGLIVALYESVDRTKAVNFLFLPVFAAIVTAIAVFGLFKLTSSLEYSLIGGMKSLESLTVAMAKLTWVLAIFAFGFGAILEHVLHHRDGEPKSWWHKIPANLAVYIMVISLLTIVCLKVTYLP